MRPEVHDAFHRIICDTRIRPSEALEVGGLVGPRSLLRFPELATASRSCLNVRAMSGRRGVEAVTGNAHDMPFEDERFDLVMSNATLEHDRQFWLSLVEMHRVLRPGGLIIIGVPGYIKDPENDRGRATLTYRVHYRFDYYRFSDQAVREVFLEGMEQPQIVVVPAPPRIIGWGWKPAVADADDAQRGLSHGENH